MIHIRFIILLLLVIINGGQLTQYTYAGGCEITSEAKASDFLKNCSENYDNGAITPTAGDSMESIKKLVSSVAYRVITFGSLFAIGAIVWSGIQYNISYGDDEKIKKAKTTGIYALIGLLILLMAFPMVNIVIEFVYNLASK